MKRFFAKLGIILVGLVFIGQPVWAKSAQAPKGAGQKIYQSVWSKSLKSGKKKSYFPEVASPVVENNTVYVGTHSGILYAYDLNNRSKLLWQADTGGPIAARALVSEQLVVVGNNKGLVSAFDAATGNKAWQTFVGGEVLGAPVKNGSQLVVVTSSREVYSLDASTGAIQWSEYVKGYETKFTMRGQASVLVFGGQLYVAFADGVVASLSNSGSLLWSQALATGQEAFRDIDATLLTDGSALYAVGYFGYLVKLSPQTGSIIWKRECRSGADMDLEGSNIAVSTTDGNVILFDKDSGQRLWERPLYSGTLSGPHIQGDYVIVGSQEKGIYVLSLSQGSVLQVIPMGSGYMGQAWPLDKGFVVLSSNARLTLFGVR